MYWSSHGKYLFVFTIDEDIDVQSNSKICLLFYQNKNEIRERNWFSFDIFDLSKKVYVYAYLSIDKTDELS